MATASMERADRHFDGAVTRVIRSAYGTPCRAHSAGYRTAVEPETDSAGWHYERMCAGRFTCPCCGWPGLTTRPYERWPDRLPVDAVAPYEEAFGRPSYEVCSCCGFEFGNDDNPGTASGVSFEQYRTEWIIQRGTPWFDSSAKPHDWSIGHQLAAAGIDAFRRELPPQGTMSGRAFADELARTCPETQRLIDEHLADHDGKLLLHLLVADVRRLVLSAFGASNRDVAHRCLLVISHALTEGNDYIRNAIAVSFVEDTGLWDADVGPFIDSWPAPLRTEAEYQRRSASKGDGA